MDGCLVEHEFHHHDQQSCNYPEVAKSFKCLFFQEKEQYCYDSSSSSELPSFTSAVSEPCSQPILIHPCAGSPSLSNYLRLSLSSEENLTNLCEASQKSEELESEGENPIEEEKLKERSCRNVLNYIDPEGWIKYASDQDPWNKKLYTQSAVEQFGCCKGVLTHEDIPQRTCCLTQLPDSKAFVFSRLHINKMDLENISVLSNYKYFLYIDMAWNLISDLNGLNNCNYLMYLNVSHNKISKVLDFDPPWFLTHVNLCCNEIKNIGTGHISEFWSLRYLDLSYNLIEKIEGLQDLRYLKYLNLSHNFIKEVENLHCTSLQEINLSFNKITNVVEDGCLQDLKDLKELHLAHNFLTELRHFDLASLEKLDISDNKITEFCEIYEIHRFRNLKDLKMIGNCICSRPGYRQFLVFKLPSLDSIDSVVVSHSERVAARMLWEPDIFTRKFHLRAKIEFWNQLPTQSVVPAIVPCDEPAIPLLVLVGAFGSNKNEIAKRLELKFPDQVYRCRQITTIPKSSNYNEDNIIPVSIGEFNNMIKDGKLLFHYNEIGNLFGVGVDQLVKCMTEDKIGVIETTMEGALVLKTTGCHPFLVLCAIEDTNSYKEILNTFFTESDLWNRYHPNGLRKMTRLGSRKESDTIGGELSDSCSCCDQSCSLPLVSQSLFTTSNLSYQSLFKNFEKRDGDNRASAGQKLLCTDDKSIQKNSETLKLEDDDDDFEWVWTYEPSVISEEQPSESYQNMVRGREEFVQRMLQQQGMCLEMNNSQPALFTAAVYSDDVDTAVKKVGRTCCEIFNKRQVLAKAESALVKPICKKFIDARVQTLLKDLVNVPAGI